MSILQPQKTLLRLVAEHALEDQLDSHEEAELARRRRNGPNAPSVGWSGGRRSRIGEELERQQALAQWSDIDVTYFVNNSSNATMLKFQVNSSNALERGFVTEEELATRNLYANDTMEIVRPAMEEVYSSPENVYGKVYNEMEFLILPEL
jgi:hypothetical protein